MVSYRHATCAIPHQIAPIPLHIARRSYIANGFEHPNVILRPRRLRRATWKETAKTCNGQQFRGLSKPIRSHWILPAGAVELAHGAPAAASFQRSCAVATIEANGGYCQHIRHQLWINTQGLEIKGVAATYHPAERSSASAPGRHRLACVSHAPPQAWWSGCQGET